MTTYLFIHGRGQERKKATGLTQSWVKALNAGFTTAGGRKVAVADVRLPYYGDALFDLVAQRGGKAKAPDLEAADPTAQLLAAMTKEAATRTGWQPQPSDPADVRDEIGLPKFLSGSLNWLAGHSKLDERIIRAYMFDVAYYLADDDCRKVVLDIVQESLDGLSGPVVVIGHSLGSVVAYDLVSHAALPRSIDVPLLLTAGSPLGLDIVRKHLPGGAKFPERAGRWVSAYSRNDPVAIGHPIKKHYRGGSLTDLEVDNPDETAHSINEYLSHDSVAKALLKAG